MAGTVKTLLIRRVVFQCDVVSAYFISYFLYTNGHPGPFQRRQWQMHEQLSMEYTLLKIQTLRGDNIPPDLVQALLEFFGKVIIAHHLGGLTHLTKQLFKSTEKADQ